MKTRLIVGILAVLTAGLNAGSLAPKLKAVLRDSPSDALISVIVQTARQADLSTLPANSSYDDKVACLRAFARDAQQGLLDHLAAIGLAEVKPFWLVSRVGLRATRDVILDLATRDDVGTVWFNDTVRLVGLEPATSTTEALDDELWNIARVKADSCWAEGYTGTGVVVGNIDTGVEVTHPAFGGRWRETNGWFDAVNGLPTPYDDHELSHGTFTMGILTGGDGPGPYTPDIGVAPGATFICAKALPGSGGGTIEMVEAALNWMADPGRPDVLSNSYGLGPGSDTFHFAAIQRLRELGMVVIFSAGNDGPGPGTIGMPASLPNVISVGATGKLDVIERFSSRGPAPDAWPWTDPRHWMRGDWERVCPSLSAPGSKIVSAVRGGGFDTSLGTSVAAPHVAGCAALLKQRYPTLTQDQTMQIIPSTADQISPGGPYPNNDFGWGRLNCLRALAAALPRDLPYIRLDTFRITDEGNHNDTLERGEDGSIAARVQNSGKLPATNVRGLLRGDEPNFTVLDSTATFGTLGVADTANNVATPFRIRVSPTCPLGFTAHLPLVLTSAETSWTRFIDIRIGAAGTGLWGPKELNGLPVSPYTSYPVGIAYSPVDDRLYATCWGSSWIRRYSSDSLVQLLDSIPIRDSCYYSADIAFSAHDTTFWVIGRLNRTRVDQIRPDGTAIRAFTSSESGTPNGITWDDESRRMYYVRGMFDTPSVVSIADTLGNVLDTFRIPLGHYGGAQGLALERTRGNPFRPALVNAYYFWNVGAQQADSMGLYMVNRSDGRIMSRFKITPPAGGAYAWLLHGVEYDPRDASYWVTFHSRSAPYHQIAKYTGFYPVAIREEAGPEPLTAGHGLHCWPNPCRTLLNVAVPTSASRSGRIEFCDVAGRRLMVLRSGPNDVSRLAPGVYFVTERQAAVGKRPVTKVILTR